jgi:hypothetical protein
MKTKHRTTSKKKKKKKSTKTGNKKVYITLKDGTDFRSIARTMTELGMPMNHATARNKLLSGIGKLLSGATGRLGIELSREQLAQLVKTSEIHELLVDVLHSAGVGLRRKGQT